jgi:serine/threonine protein kinase
MNTIGPGLKIGNYVLQSLIGKGGMGSVFLAEHPEIGRQVAIKFLSPHLSHQPGISDRFVSEARAVSRVDHANIIHIYDFGRMPSGQLYYVMELLHGQELSAVMKRGIMGAEEIAPYLGQICAGLFAAHRKGVVHRDLKPQNIFVLNRQPLALKILDFGIAKIIETEEGEGSLTATGAVLGSPLFISPEQAMGRPDLITERTDIYSLGIILYWMLTGRPPFRDMPTALLMAKHIEVDPPPVQSFAPDVPSAVADLVERCLAKDPSARPESTRALFAEYVECCELDDGIWPSHFSESMAGVTLPVNSVAEMETFRPGSQQARIGTGADNVDSEAANSETIGLTGDNLISVTTLGGAAGEISILSEAPRSLPSRRSAGLTMAAVALAAVGLYVALDSERTEEPAAAVQSKVRANPSNVERASPPKANNILQPLIEIESRDAVARCRARLEGKWLATQDTPCRYETEPGKKFQVEVQLGNQTPFVREFVVVNGKRFRLRSSEAEQRLMIVDREPAVDSAVAVRKAPVRQPIARRRGTRRRRRGTVGRAKPVTHRTTQPLIAKNATAKRAESAGTDAGSKPQKVEANKTVPKDTPPKAAVTTTKKKPVPRATKLGEGTSPF